MLKTICYRSKADDSLTMPLIKGLFQQTKQNNDSNNIHGVLVLHKGSFFQVLEGEEVLLDDLYEKIKKDTRHSDIQEILNEPINDVLFKNFGAGYVIVDNIEALYTLQQYTNFLDIDNSENKNQIFFDIITGLIKEDA